MVPQKGDARWTDVANWVLRALVRAEMNGVTQSNVHDINFLLSYGSSHGIDFVEAIATVGNYGEIY